MNSILTSIMSDLGPLALLVLAAVVFAETGLLIGFFLPGDSLLFTAGLMIASHILPLPLPALIAATWVAAATGDQVAYWIGTQVRRRMYAGERSRWVRGRHWVSAQEFFDQHGHKAVIMARFVPVVRTFTPVVAGAVEMPRRRFTIYNIVGGLLWTGGMSLAGYLLGDIPIVANHVDIVTVGVILLSLLPAVVRLVMSRRRKLVESGRRPEGEPEAYEPRHISRDSTVRHGASTKHSTIPTRAAGGADLRKRGRR